MLPFRAGVCCVYTTSAFVNLVFWFIRRRRGGGVWERLRWGISLTLLSCVGQEELAMLRRQLEGTDGEMRRLQEETGFKAISSSSTDPIERGGKPRLRWACVMLNLMISYILNLIELQYLCILVQHQALFYSKWKSATNHFLFHNSLSCLVSHPDETLRKRLKEKRKGCFYASVHYCTLWMQPSQPLFAWTSMSHLNSACPL